MRLLSLLLTTVTALGFGASAACVTIPQEPLMDVAQISSVTRSIVDLAPNPGIATNFFTTSTYQDGRLKREVTAFPGRDPHITYDYTYNTRGQLLQIAGVTLSSKSTTTMRYDAQGRKLGETETSVNRGGVKPYTSEEVTCAHSADGRTVTQHRQWRVGPGEDLYLERGVFSFDTSGRLVTYVESSSFDDGKTYESDFERRYTYDGERMTPVTSELWFLSGEKRSLRERDTYDAKGRRVRNETFDAVLNEPEFTTIDTVLTADTHGNWTAVQAKTTMLGGRIFTHLVFERDIVYRK